MYISEINICSSQSADEVCLFQLLVLHRACWTKLCQNLSVRSCPATNDFNFTHYADNRFTSGLIFFPLWWKNKLGWRSLAELLSAYLSIRNCEEKNRSWITLEYWLEEASQFASMALYTRNPWHRFSDTRMVQTHFSNPKTTQSI